MLQEEDKSNTNSSADELVINQIQDQQSSNPMTKKKKDIQIYQNILKLIKETSIILLLRDKNILQGWCRSCSNYLVDYPSIIQNQFLIFTPMQKQSLLSKIQQIIKFVNYIQTDQQVRLFYQQLYELLTKFVKKLNGQKQQKKQNGYIKRLKRISEVLYEGNGPKILAAAATPLTILAKDPTQINNFQYIIAIILLGFLFAWIVKVSFYRHDHKKQ